MQALGQHSIEHAILSNDTVVIVFFASWCPSCAAFAPVFEAAANKFPEIFFGTVDADKEPELAEQFTLRSVPTLVIFREKIMVFSNAGAPPPPVFDNIIRQALGLDMNAVRKDIENQLDK